jgi:hypothetical protein
LKNPFYVVPPSPITLGLLLKMSRITEACEFAFEFKKKYENRIENLEKNIDDSFSRSSESEEEQIININHPSSMMTSVKNMIPITEVDHEEHQKKSLRTEPDSGLQYISKQFQSQNSKDFPYPPLVNSVDSHVVDRLLVLECAFSLEEQFNCLKEKIMFFYSFTEKYILDSNKE